MKKFKFLCRGSKKTSAIDRHSASGGREAAGKSAIGAKVVPCSRFTPELTLGARLAVVSPRRGVSLMEVLMSIFILTVGLLGMASLIPVGGFQVSEAIKADRAATVGRAAFNEVRMRGLLDPRAWRNGNSVDTSQFFVIDPLGNNQNGGFKVLLNSSQLVHLRRWRDDNQEINPALIRHIFTSHDDLIFVPADNPDDPPRQVLGTTGKRPSGHQYSWLVTVVPVGSEAGGQSTQGELHRVSVAVFHSRQPNDQTAMVPVVSASVDGGSLPFGTLVLTGLGNAEQTKKKLQSLKDNRWIFITDGGGVHRWYRIILRRGNRITVDGPQIDFSDSNLQSKSCCSRMWSASTKIQ
ncbi:MAG: hypothetical protein IID44_05835 [Planctomycetes bacterium]|nr:hypothetical protein [Planctomycetota bacterium]